MSIQIRCARPEEFDRIGDIVVAAYDTVGTIEGDYRAFMHDTARRVAAGAEVRVAVDETGGLVGSVTFADGGSAHHEHGPHSDCGFRLLAVDPDRQGEGIGRALVRHCVDMAADRGRLRLMIYSMEWMRPAHSLYESMGFRRRRDRDVRFPSGLGYAFDLDLADVPPGTFPPPGPVADQPPWFEDFLDLRRTSTS